MVAIITGHSGHLNHVTWTKYINLLMEGSMKNLIEIGPVVLEEKLFENDDKQRTSDLY